MDSDIVCWAYKLQSLVNSKHQYARTIDASTRQLIQLVIGQSKPPADKKEPPYAPTKEAFHADLLTFAHAVFRQLSKPPTDITKALKAHVTRIDRVMEEHAARLAGHMDQYHIQNMERFNRLGA